VADAGSALAAVLGRPADDIRLRTTPSIRTLGGP
jgi:hypothetical protein